MLETEDQLNAYIASYGEMHITKCRLAMQNFPYEELALSKGANGSITRIRNIEIYDWGCGQGLGTLACYRCCKSATCSTE